MRRGHDPHVRSTSCVRPAPRNQRQSLGGPIQPLRVMASAHVSGSGGAGRGAVGVEDETYDYLDEEDVVTVSIDELPPDFADVIRGTTSVVEAMMDDRRNPIHGYNVGGQGGFARAVYPLGKKTALEWHEGRVCETRLGFKDLLMDESMTRHILSKMDGYVYFSTPFYVTDPARGLSAGSSYGRRPDGRMGGTVKGLLEHLIALVQSSDSVNIKRLIQATGPLKVFGTGIELQQALSDSDVHAADGVVLRGIQPTENAASRGDYEFRDITPDAMKSAEQNRVLRIRVVLQSQLRPDGLPTGMRFVLVGLGSLEDIKESAYLELVDKLYGHTRVQNTAEDQLLAALVRHATDGDPAGDCKGKDLMINTVLRIASESGRPYRSAEVQAAFAQFRDRTEELSDLTTILSRAKRVVSGEWWSVLREALEVPPGKMLCVTF